MQKLFGSFVQDEITARTLHGILAGIGIGIFIILLLPFPWASIGLVIAVISALLIPLGWKHTQDPDEGLVIKEKGKVIERNGDTVVLTGDFLLPVWPPFLISGRLISLAYVQWVFDANVLSVEKTVLANGEKKQIPLSGKLTMTVKVDKRDASNFLLASRGGNIENIKPDVGPIAVNALKNAIVSHIHSDGRIGLTAVEITQKSKVLSDDLQKNLNGHKDPDGTEKDGLFAEKKYGIEAVTVQFEADMPEDMKQSMVDAGSIDYESAAREAEYEADIAAAESFQKRLKMKDPKQAWDAAVESRLMRDKFVRRVQMETKGSSGSGMTIVGTKVNFGDDRDTKKKGGN